MQSVISDYHRHGLLAIHFASTTDDDNQKGNTAAAPHLPLSFPTRLYTRSPRS